MPPQVEKTKEMTTLSVVVPLANRIRAIADHRGMTISDALERYAGEALLREWRKVVGEQSRDTPGGEG